MITTADGPVMVPLQDGGRERRVLAAFFLLLPLAVVVAAFFHPVLWWGWLAAACWTAMVIWHVLRRPAVESCRLEDETFVLDGRAGLRRIPARDVARVVSFDGLELPALVLDGGPTLPLNTKPLWRGTAYPTARVLAEWVKEHGGGRDDQHQEPVLARGSWKQYLAFMVALGVMLSCCFSAIEGDRTPQASQALFYFLGFAIVGVVRRRRKPAVTKDWTGSPRPW